MSDPEAARKKKAESLAKAREAKKQKALERAAQDLTPQPDPSPVTEAPAPVTEPYYDDEDVSMDDDLLFDDDESMQEDYDEKPAPAPPKKLAKSTLVSVPVKLPPPKKRKREQKKKQPKQMSSSEEDSLSEESSVEEKKKTKKRKTYDSERKLKQAKPQTKSWSETIKDFGMEPETAYSIGTVAAMVLGFMWLDSHGTARVDPPIYQQPQPAPAYQQPATTQQPRAQGLMPL